MAASGLPPTTAASIGHGLTLPTSSGGVTTLQSPVSTSSSQLASRSSSKHSCSPSNTNVRWCHLIAAPSTSAVVCFPPVQVNTRSTAAVSGHQQSRCQGQTPRGTVMPNSMYYRYVPVQIPSQPVYYQQATSVCMCECVCVRVGG